MNLFRKSKLLGEAGRFDSCGPKSCESKIKNGLSGLFRSPSENKNCVMLKTLMTNKCCFDCKYCPNSSRSINKESVSFSSDELLRVFEDSRRVGVNSLFLSSGIPSSSDKVMEDMLEGVEKIRKKFSGYVHLKIMPGTPFEFVKRAASVADRLSVNIESPNSSSLGEVSDCKDFKIDILRRQAWIKRLGKSQSTQMIVRSDDSDKNILKMANWEYKNLGLKRVYYSSFSPVKGTLMENDVCVSKKREAFLYKSDFLLRDYNFDLNDLFNVLEDDMLPSVDPKIMIAKNYFSNRLDVCEASEFDLLRVPGIGPVTARRVFFNQGKVKNFKDLKRLGVNISRASPFISIKDKKQLCLDSFS